MKKILLSIIVSLGCIFAASAQSGNLTGIVFGEEKTTLVGATVQIEKLHKTTIVDNEGRYTVNDIEVGTHLVTISYIGYTKKQQEVTIAAGKTATIDFTLEPGLALEGVTVTGQIGNTIKALNQQRNALNIVNVISSDQIGSFPDMNIGDALKRIPGVYVSYNEGEADMVNIRGTGPNFSNFTINGVSIPSSHLLSEENDDPTEMWAASARGFSIQGIPSDMVSSVEVNKTLTADMDGDAIGGSVNLVTRKAPYERRLSVSSTGGYNALVSGGSYNGNLFYGERFFDNKLGVVLSASLYDQNLGSNSQRTERWNMETVGTKDANGVVNVADYFLPNDFEIKQTIMERLRQSYTAGFDWQINPRHNISFTGIFNDYKEWKSQYTFKVDDLGGRALWKKADGSKTVSDFYGEYEDAGDAFDAWNEWAEEVDPDGDGVMGDGSLMYDFDPTHPTYYPEVERHIFAGENKNKGGGLTHSRIMNGALAGEHQFDILKANWGVAYVKTSEDRPDTREFEFQTDGPEDAKDGEGGSKMVTLDISNPRFINLSSEVDYGNIQEFIAGKESDDLEVVNGWYLDGFNGLTVKSSSELWNAHADFELPLVSEGLFQNRIKFGGKLKAMTKESVDGAITTWFPKDDNWGWFWNEFANNLHDISNKFTNSKYRVGMMPDTKWIASQTVNGSEEGAETANWVADELDGGDIAANSYIGTENVYAGYLMGTQNFGPKVQLNAGLRLEHTVLKFEGVSTQAPLPVQNYDETVSYNSWLPSFNLRYTPINRVVLRAAYSKTISRQSFNDIKPSVSVNITRDPATYSLGNPELKPWYSHNFDLLGEFYPTSIGLISAGVYHKQIRGFNYTRESQTPWGDVRGLLLTPGDALLQQYVTSGIMSEEDLEDYTEAYDRMDSDGNAMLETNQRVNSDASASITGVELAFQRRLDFLPGYLRNLSLYTNYTHNWLSDPEEDESGETVRLPGTASDAFNASLSYETRRLSARLSYNYTSSFLANPGTGDLAVYRNRYCDAVNYLDLNIDYHIIPQKLIITGAVNNILDESSRYYYWKEQYTASNVSNGTRFQLGLIWNIF